MSLLPPEQVRLFLSLPAAQQQALIAELSPADLLRLDADFEIWAHAGQLPPDVEGWRVWLMMAGRGFGKTRAGAEWIHQLAMMGDKRIALVGATIDEARAIMVEGVSGLLGIARRGRVKVIWEPGLKRLTWPRGSIATLFSGENPDGIRGAEHDFAWCIGAGRPAGRGIDRAGRDRRASVSSGDRHAVPRRDQRGERRLRGAGGQARGVDRRWLAVHRAGRRDAPDRARQRP